MKQEKVIDAIINNDEIGVIMDENPNNAISEKFTPNNKEVCIQKSRAIPVEIKKIDSNAIIPTRGTSESAGADLYANINNPISISPQQTKMIGTGISMKIPDGFVGLIYPRSGISVKRDLAPANKVGVIDSDYRGEIMVALHNHGTTSKIINPNERIAQIVFTEYYVPIFNEVEELDDTERGEGGFGSTGAK
jgi:dUTP pyrophosphatase